MRANGKDNKGKGKGKGGGFQGNCLWCGEWGHSQSRCRHKDEYMNEIRRTKGQERNGYQTNSMENVKPPDHHDLETLENCSWRTLCYLRSTFRGGTEP